MGHRGMEIAQHATFAYLVIAAIDYAWQRQRNERKLRMTKQELKDEQRQYGLPAEVKAALRRRQAQAARKRMMAAVPEADVVIANPTHFAVALRYDGSRTAPEVVAKGQDLIALQIRRIAEEHDVADRLRAPARARAARLRRDRPGDPRGAVRRRGARARVRLPPRPPTEVRAMSIEDVITAARRAVHTIKSATDGGAGMNLDTVRRLLRHTDLLAAIAVVMVVTMLVVPLPSALLDLLITLNISAALTIVVATMYLGKALDFASFPSLLLLTTMFRLAINVSVTRLILTTGDAGSVVKAFGEFVVARQRRRRPRDLPDPRGDPVRGRHQRRRARRRGRRALHARRDARQADGDRRRPQRRADHRRAGPQPPLGDRPGSRLLRRDGRRLEVRQRRRDGGGDHHRDQPRSAASSWAWRSTASPSPKRPTSSRC